MAEGLEARFLEAFPPIAARLAHKIADAAGGNSERVLKALLDAHEQGELTADDFDDGFLEGMAGEIAQSLLPFLLAAAGHVFEEAKEELPPGQEIDREKALEQAVEALGGVGQVGPVSMASVDFPEGKVNVSDWHKVKPKEAIAFWKQRTGIPSELFEALDESARAYAFTIAGVESQHVIDAAFAGIRAALEEGETFRNFRDRVDQAMDKAGLDLIDPWKLKATFRQNVLTAYGAGRSAVQRSEAVKKYLPYRVYKSQMDGKERPSHRALHNTCLPADDPFWDTYDTPWDWGCRCYTRSVRKPREGWQTDPSRIVRPGVPEAFAGSNPLRTWREGGFPRDVPFAQFSSGMKKMREDRKPFVTFYSAKQYREKGARLFMNRNGTAGYALTRDKELISVFSNEAGAGGRMIKDAVRRGADRLDCFDGELVRIYGKHGFVETGRDPWNDEYKPKNWDKYYPGQKPDLVYLRREKKGV